MKFRTWKRSRVIVVSIASLSLLVLSIAFVWRIAHETSIRAEVQKMVDDLQSRGLPTDMESLQSVYDAKPNPPNLEVWLDLIERVSRIDVPSLHQPIQATEVLDYLGREPSRASSRLKSTCRVFMWESEATPAELRLGSAGASPFR